MNKPILYKTGLAIAFMTGFSINLSTSLQNIMVGIFIFASLFSPYLREALKDAFKNTFIMGAMILYLVLMMGTLWSDAPSRDILSMLMRMALYLLSPLIYVYFYDRANVRAFFWGFASCVILSVLLSTLSSISGLDFFHPTTGIHTEFAWIKIDLFRGHVYQNYFSGLVSVVLLVLLLEGYFTYNKHRVLVVLLLALIFINIIFFVTGRTGQILYVLMLLIVTAYYMKKSRLKLLASSLILLIPITFYFSGNIRDGINRAVSDLRHYEAGEANTSLGLRLTFYKNSFALIESAPLYGHGTGSFRHEYEKLNDKVMRSVGNPHNDYLWFAVELGIIGMTAFIIFLAGALYQSYHTIGPYGLLSFILITTYALSSIGNSFFTDNITGQFFILALCALMANNEHDDKHYHSRI